MRHVCSLPNITLTHLGEPMALALSHQESCAHYRLLLLYCPDHVTSAPRSYFESLSTSGPGPSIAGFAKVSSRERGQRASLHPWGWGIWRLFQKRVPLRLCPDARVGPVARKYHCVRREGQQLSLYALDQLLPVPPFEVGATDAAPEQCVPGEDQPVTVVRNPPRGVTVSFDYRKGEVSNLDCVALL